MPAKLPTSGNRISGSLTPLSPLPNPDHHASSMLKILPLVEMAEFLSPGVPPSMRFCLQGHADPKTPRYEYREISITAPEVPRDCFRNGITTSGHYLYLACAHVHQWDKSVLPEWGSPLSTISQTQPLNVLRLLMTETFGHADSYILRADLQKDPLEFAECFTIPEKCFANGLAIDQAAHQDVVFLYVANSIFGQSSIFRITWPNERAKDPTDCIEWFTMFTHQLINGLKYCANRVYYTCIQLFPPGVPSVYRIDVHDREPERVFWTFGFFDDLDVLEHGLIVANGADFSDFPQTIHLRHAMPTGSLIFVSSEGELIKVFRDEKVTSSELGQGSGPRVPIARERRYDYNG